MHIGVHVDHDALVFRLLRAIGVPGNRPNLAESLAILTLQTARLLAV